jgi:hypothetical protein
MKQGFWDGATPGEIKHLAAFYRRHRCEELPGECNGRDAEQAHYHTVYGQSGEYQVVANAEGEIIRDDRPWQMTES